VNGAFPVTDGRVNIARPARVAAVAHDVRAVL